MARTVSLNSVDTIWVTTYSGGERGTCLDISMQLDSETQVTRTFTVQELLDTLKIRGMVKGLAKPEFEH